MSVSVPLEELAGALASRSNAAYLLTVAGDGRAHCVASTLEWVGDQLLVPAGSTSVRNAADRGSVVLLAPPAGGLLSTPADTPSAARGSPSGPDPQVASRSDSVDTYSLIVDAEVSGTSATTEQTTGVATTRSGGWVRLRPVHAVFHRPAVAPSGHAHDCVHLYDEPAPAG